MASNNFATATEVVITTDGGTFSESGVNNTTYNSEASEPNNGGSSVRSAWWKYTPVTTGTATFDTQLTTSNGSHTNTVLAIYTGTALNNLVLVASNNDGGGSVTSLIPNQAVTAGVTYWCQVGAFGAAIMNYGFRVTGEATTGGGGGGDGNVTGVPASASASAIPPSSISAESVISGGGPATASAQALAPTVIGGAGGDGNVVGVSATAIASAHSPNVSDGNIVPGTIGQGESRADNAMRRLRIAGYSGSLHDMQREYLFDQFGGLDNYSVADLQIHSAGLDQVYDILPDSILPGV